VTATPPSAPPPLRPTAGRSARYCSRSPPSLHGPPGPEHPRAHLAARARLVGVAVRGCGLLVHVIYAFGFLIAGMVARPRGCGAAALPRRSWCGALAAIGMRSHRTTAAFAAARAPAGLGESANFPGAIRAWANWFPKEERGPRHLASSTPAPTPARSSTPLQRSGHRAALGWRWAFGRDGIPGFFVAGRMARSVSQPTRPNAHRPTALGFPGRQAPPDLGHRRRQIPGRPRVVVFLSVLAPEIPGPHLGIKLAQVALPLITV